MLREPTAVGVTLTEHVADAPVPDSVHGPPGVNVTVPVGAVAPVVDVSVTVAVQLVGALTATGEGVQATVAEVG